MSITARSAERPWAVVIESASAIRTLCGIFDSMLDFVEVRLRKSASFEGIAVEATDATQVSLVSAQLACRVSIDSSNADDDGNGGDELGGFCVNARTFAVCMKSALAHSRVIIESIAESGGIRVALFDPRAPTSIKRFTISTQERDDEPMRLRDHVCMYHIQMPVSCLMPIVRMCSQMGGDALTLEVAHPAARAGKKRSAPDVTRAVLTISSHGACTQEHTYYWTTETHGDGVVVVKSPRAVSDPCEKVQMDTTFRQSYTAKHLERFLKRVDRPSITLKLGHDGRLVIYHEFMASSFVSFVLAPHVQGDESTAS